MKTKLLVVSFTVAILLSACGATAPVTPTVDVQALYTSAAKTVVAELTQTAAAVTPTLPASATPKITITSTPTNTSTVALTNPPAPETAQPSPTTPAETISAETAPTDYPCNNAVFVADISVPDGTPMSPGEEFEKTWRIKNTGTCTWGTGYGLVYGYGIKMNGQPLPLNESVFPGGVIDITVKFTAPEAAGTYKSYWRMVNAYGANFGEFFYVEIRVG